MPYEISIGVLLEPGAFADGEDSFEVDETGHVPASRWRGRHEAARGTRLARHGHDVVRAAAHAVGEEVAFVVAGIASGIERKASLAAPGAFDVDSVDLKFGVKTVLGAGKAIQALLTASGEATVEVTVKLKRPLDEVTP